MNPRALHMISFGLSAISAPLQAVPLQVRESKGIHIVSPANKEVS